MTRGERLLTSRHLAIAAIASIVSSSSAFADSVSRQYAAVVCTSEASGPWTLRARGTLTRTKSKHELIYRLDIGEHGYTWSFITNRDGNTTVTGPGFLMDRLGAPPAQPELGSRRQSLDATGEIREYAGPSGLSLLIGSRCPTRGPRLPPKSTIDLDAARVAAGHPERWAA
jgi:hypothetical protein